MTNFGASIVSIKLPSKENGLVDVVLGFDDFQGYANKSNPYFGVINGRVANRISNGTFKLDGQKYSLAQNDQQFGNASVHGGVKGFDKVLWKADIDHQDNIVTFSYLSPDGEEGYPGDLITNVTYKLTQDNTLTLNMKAMTSKTTLANLSNHAFFNLAGHDSGSKGLKEHLVIVNADLYTPTSSDLIPTGEIRDVSETKFDLRKPRKLGDIMGKEGYDVNFSINGNPEELRLVCRFEHPETQRALECFSDQPGLEFYTGNYLPSDGSLKGKDGCTYEKHGGFVLETQKYPDAINKGFDDAGILRPGQVYHHQVIFKFFF